MNEKKLRNYYEIYTESWKLFRKYSAPDDSEAFWDGLQDEMEEIWKRHGKSDFSKKILLATREEIEKIWKKGKGNGRG